MGVGDAGLLIATGDKTRASSDVVVRPVCLASEARLLDDVFLTEDLFGDSIDLLRSNNSSSSPAEARLLFFAWEVCLWEDARSNLNSSNASSRSRVRELIVCMASLRSRWRVRSEATICFSSAGIE